MLLRPPQDTPNSKCNIYLVEKKTVAYYYSESIISTSKKFCKSVVSALQKNVCFRTVPVPKIRKKNTPQLRVATFQKRTPSRDELILGWYHSVGFVGPIVTPLGFVGDKHVTIATMTRTVYLPRIYHTNQPYGW